MLLQISLGDRCDCARQATTDWFSGLQRGSPNLPSALIPEVNGKTKPRRVPLHPSFADMLWGWIADKPLCSGREQWPFLEQELAHATREEKTTYLFCGRSGNGRNLPVLHKPISERAFLKQITRAARILAQERLAAHKNHEIHVFDDIDLSKLGTHSWKKTAVTLMKDQRISTSIVHCGGIDWNFTRHIRFYL